MPLVPTNDGGESTLTALTVLVKTPDGTGSGFWYLDPASERAYVLTNRHVVSDYSSVEVCWAIAQQCSFGTVLVQSSKGFDVAVIDVPDESTIGQYLTPEVVGNYLNEVKYGGHWAKGDVVYASGYPGGNKAVSDSTISNPVVTEGIVAQSQLVQYSSTGYLEHGADVEPGSSGGPLFNSSGQVIAIIAAGSTLHERLELAIPMSDVLLWLATGAEPGSVRVPSLSLNGDDVQHESPLLTGKSALILGSAENPFPINESGVYYPNWGVNVSWCEEDQPSWATSSGNVSVLARIFTSYIGDSRGSFFTDVAIDAVGKSRQIYESLDLLTSPPRYEQPYQSPGQYVQIFIEFQVPAEDANPLLLRVREIDPLRGDTLGHFAMYEPIDCIRDR
jgi:hypothetical protein